MKYSPLKLNKNKNFIAVGDPTVDIMMTNIGTVMEEMDIGEVMEDIVTMEEEDMVMEEDMDIEYY